MDGMSDSLNYFKSNGINMNLDFVFGVCGVRYDRPLRHDKRYKYYEKKEKRRGEG